MRPASYESEQEAEFLLELFSRGGDQLQNTIFALLAPGGSEKLARTGRGPSFAFDDAEGMARELMLIAKRFDPSKEATERSLPTLPDLRLALNVAACDSLPLVVGVLRHDDDASKRERSKADAELRGHLAELCFDERAIGRAHYVVVEGDTGLRAFDGFDAKSDVFVLAPGAYGIEAAVLAATRSADDECVDHAVAGLDRYAAVEKEARAHVRAARQLGIEWESKLPITDDKASKRKSQE